MINGQATCPLAHSFYFYAIHMQCCSFTRYHFYDDLLTPVHFREVLGADSFVISKDEAALTAAAQVC